VTAIARSAGIENIRRLSNMKRIMCARCKQGIEPDKINKITPNTFVCNSCYDELLQVDIRSTNRNMEERHKVLAALTFEEYFPDDEED